MKALFYKITFLNKLKHWIQKLGNTQKISLIYLLNCFLFIYLHESHLTAGVFALLSISTLLFSVICLILTIFILSFLFEKKNLFWDLLVLLLLLASLFGLNFLNIRGNLLFIGITAIFALFFLFSRQWLYYRILQIGLAILVNALVSFQFLQTGEVLLFQKLVQNKLIANQQDYLQWSFDKVNRLLSNSKIPLYLKLPTGLFFHNPKNLTQKDKTGMGQLVGVISTGDERDPNIYPYIRLFILSSHLSARQQLLHSEFGKYLTFLKSRGEISEINYLGTANHAKKKWSGEFWTFYDKLRPRYAKIGYYTMKLDSKKILLIEIMDNLTKNHPHTKRIETVLESITRSVKL